MVDGGVPFMLDGLAVEEHEGAGQAKVGSEGVDDHGATDVCSLQGGEEGKREEGGKGRGRGEEGKREGGVKRVKRTAGACTMSCKYM